MTESHRPAGGVWTYEQYTNLPDVEGLRYEIIAGHLHVLRTPPLLHAVFIGSFLEAVYGWVRQHGVGRFLPGPLNVVFANGDFLLPDFVFVRSDRLDVVTDRAIEGVPDLIVECVAPETREMDRVLKRERYSHFGVPEYWIVDPEARAVERYRPDSTYPVVVTDCLTWQPVANGPSLNLHLSELLADYDETRRMIEENEQRFANGRRLVSRNR